MLEYVKSYVCIRRVLISANILTNHTAGRGKCLPSFISLFTPDPFITDGKCTKEANMKEHRILTATEAQRNTRKEQEAEVCFSHTILFVIRYTSQNSKEEARTHIVSSLNELQHTFPATLTTALPLSHTQTHTEAERQLSSH